MIFYFKYLNFYKNKKQKLKNKNLIKINKNKKQKLKIKNNNKNKNKNLIKFNNNKHYSNLIKFNKHYSNLIKFLKQKFKNKNKNRIYINLLKFLEQKQIKFLDNLSLNDPKINYYKNLNELLFNRFIEKYILNFKKVKNKINYIGIMREKNYKKIFYLKVFNKLRSTVGICLYKTLNNFYLVCIDISLYNDQKSKVLCFFSGGMVNRTKRFNRTNKFSIEFASRKIAKFLKEKKNLEFRIILILYSFIYKGFLKALFKGFSHNKIYFKKIYDRRRLAHNGCLLRKMGRK